jgi:hypothetical protein
VLFEESRVLFAQRLLDRAEIARRVSDCNLAHAFRLLR